MNNQRPVNLAIGTIRLPITSYASILHRVSGVFLFVAVAILLYLLDLSLASEQGFAQVRELLGSDPVKFVMWTILAGLAYHTLAGVRHLIMDIGIGESLKGGVLGAKLLFGSFAILVVVAGIWLW